MHIVCIPSYTLQLQPYHQIKSCSMKAHACLHTRSASAHVRPGIHALEILSGPGNITGRNVAGKCSPLEDGSELLPAHTHIPLTHSHAPLTRTPHTHPTYSASWASLEAEQGNTELARSLLEEGLALYPSGPSSVGALVVLAKVERMEGRLEEARRLLDRASKVRCSV
jgi:hypothetical protein